VSPYDGSGEVVIEDSDGLLWTSRVNVAGQKAEIEFPVNKNWNRHDIYVSANIYRPESEVIESQKSMVFGITHLTLDRKDRQVSLEIKHPESVEPNEELEIVIQADKADPGTYVTLAAVDEGILALKAFQTPAPWNYFFRKLGYHNAIFDNFARVTHKFQGKLAMRYGGDGFLSVLAESGGAFARADVKIVSIFTKPIPLEKNGEAKIKLKIPQFNGELRLMALAFSKDSYGTGESFIKVAEPIVTELSMPRFLATGDTVELSLDVRNMMDTKQNISITTEVLEPLRLLGSADTKLSLDKGKRAIIKIPITGKGTGGYGTINISVSGHKPTSTKKSWRLAVRPPYPAVTQTEITTIEAGATAQLFKNDLKKYIPNSATLSILITNVLPLGIESHFDGLLQYPYGCLEQTVSSTYPLLFATPNVLRMFSLQMPPGHVRQELVAAGINRLTQKVLRNGGFGYWDSTSYESKWGTVYAAEFLTEAKRLGFNIPNNLHNNAIDRITAYLRGDTGSEYSGFYDTPSIYQLAVSSYAAYVLAKNDIPLLADTRKVYNAFKDSAKTPVPMFMLAYALKKFGDTQNAEEAYRTGLRLLKASEYRYYGDYSSPARDGVWSLILIKEYNSSENIAKLLLEMKGDLYKSWYSTQERIRLFQTAITLAQSGSVNGTLIAQNTKEKIESEIFSRTLRGGKVADVAFQSDTKADLYARTAFIAYPSTAPDIIRTNADVQRRYLDVNGKVISLENVSVGDYVVVEVRAAVKANSADGLIVELIPAGFELENQNLDNSLKLSSLEIPHYRNNAVYSEYRDDRFIAAVNIRKDNSVHIWYLMRAVTPGSFTNPSPYFEDMYRDDVRAVGAARPFMINVLPK
jgi:uncharacterized protein YfaS (alpha-2-macroglobulin family)